MNWSDLTVAGIPISALIVAAVKICTDAGMARKWAPALAIGVGVVCSLCAEVVTRDYSWSSWISVALVGLWFGLGAVGGHAALTHTVSAVKERNANDGS